MLPDFSTNKRLMKIRIDKKQADSAENYFLLYRLCKKVSIWTIKKLSNIEHV